MTAGWGWEVSGTESRAEGAVGPQGDDGGGAAAAEFLLLGGTLSHLMTCSKMSPEALCL